MTESARAENVEHTQLERTQLDKCEREERSHLDAAASCVQHERFRDMLLEGTGGIGVPVRKAPLIAVQGTVFGLRCHSRALTRRNCNVRYLAVDCERGINFAIMVPTHYPSCTHSRIR